MIKKPESGFTLIELMVVIVIIGIISVAIVRGFSRFNANAEETRAQKQMMDISLQLEKYRAENLTFKGFATSSINLPVGSTGNKIRYTVTVVDTEAAVSFTTQKATGYAWALKAVAATGATNYSLLLNSYGERCKNLTASQVTYKDCGTAIQGSEQW